MPRSPIEKVVNSLRAAECYGWQTSETGDRLVGLGDSLTSGSEHTLPGFLDETSWYSHLVCADRGFADSGNLGESGQASAQIASRVDAALAARPDVLVIGAGTNDLRDGVPTADTIANLRVILDRTVLVPAVFLAVVPPSYNTDATELNEQIANLAVESGRATIDFAEVVRRPGASDDAIHPNVNGAQQLADVVFSAVSSA